MTWVLGRWVARCAKMARLHTFGARTKWLLPEPPPAYIAMSFFDKIFQFGSPKETQPDIPFGRYSDTYRSQARYDAWDKAVELFEKEERMEAYRQFLVYLHDEQQDNVAWREEDGSLHFEIWQGSRVVRGTANAETVKATSRIARADVTNVGFMRRLMEYNFSLKYSRFGLSPDNVITILFDTSTTDGSPLKLFNALKEMAVHADKQDDLLLDEFRMLQTVEPLSGNEIPEAEKEVKYGYIQHEIKKAFDEMDKGKPDPNQYPGGYAYMFLYLAYKLDYLVKPEGFMMDALEKIHRAYFASSAEEKSTQLKNIAFRKEFQKLLDRPKEEFFKEMYRTRSTFGITTPVGHEKLAALIEGELPNMDWYKDNNHIMLALGIPGYIVGYALFNYALPKPDREFLHLYLQIMEAGYFRDLGFKLGHYDAAGKPDKRAILRSIRAVAERNRAQYPKVSPDTSNLDFGSPVLFAKAYLEMVKNLDMTKAD